MRGILHSLLVFALTLFYVVGPYVMVELEHSHDVRGDHGHAHHEADSGHDDHTHDQGHSHDHDSLPPADDPHDDKRGGDSHGHSHLVALGTDAPFTFPALPKIHAVRWTTIRASLPDPEFCPDGPCFPLIKPPQLG